MGRTGLGTTLRSRSRFHWELGWTLILTISLAPVAQADNSSTTNSSIQLQEIVVTATKRPESALNVPVSLSAISASEIESRGYTNYNDFLNAVPGVNFSNQGPSEGQLNIRGLVSGAVSGFPVATYFGDTVTSVLTTGGAGGGVANPSLVDIDRVEVLRGPQGTLFGADALAGVVRIIPNAPNLSQFEAGVDTRGYATAHSADGSYHVDGMLNLPLVDNRLALRLVGYKDSVSGYIDNVVPATPSEDYSASYGAPPGTLVLPAIAASTRKDVNTENIWGARAALRWRPTDQLQVDINFMRQNDAMKGEPQIQPQAGSYDQDVPTDLFAPAGFGYRLDLASAAVTYDWSAVTLKSITSYTKIYRWDSFDAGFLAASAGLGPQLWMFQDEANDRVITQETRLQSSGNAALQWLIGTWYSSEARDLGQQIPDLSCPTCLPTVLLNQNFALESPAPGQSPHVFGQRQRSVFGDVSYAFLEHWTLGVGGRYLDNDLEALVSAQEGLVVNGYSAAQPPAAGTNVVFNPSGYVRFKPQQDMTLYFQASRGFRGGTPNAAQSFTGTCAAEAANVGLGAVSNPDTLWSYELGMKSLLADRRVELNTDVYRQDWSGIQLGTDLACGFNGIINGGSSRGYGGELEVNVRLTQAWSVNLSAAEVQNRFQSVATPSSGYTVGELVPGAPERNASAGLQYDFALGTAWSGFARADWTYVGDTHYVFGPGDNAVQAAYDTVNVRTGIRRSAWSFTVFANNVTDQRAIESLGDPLLGGYQYLVRPREIGLDVDYMFH